MEDENSGVGFGEPILYCILVSKKIFPDKEVFDNFYGSFADRDRVGDKKLGKKGAEDWLEDTI